MLGTEGGALSPVLHEVTVFLHLTRFCTPSTETVIKQ